MSAPRSARAESAVQVLVLLAVGGMAGAASFTHMHDWTMANSPAHTPEWFGWGNAVISELTPVVAGLEVRRRRRNDEAPGLALGVLAVFAGLSLAAQFAQAKPGFSGWLLAGLPAAAFMILIKLVLSRTPAEAEVPVPVRAEVWRPAPAEVAAKPEAVRAEVSAPAMRKEAPTEAEVPQVRALFPLSASELRAGSRAEVYVPAERKVPRKSEGLVVARRSPETTWKAAQDVMAAEPELPFKDVADRVGVSDRRLRQIRTEMTQAVSV